MLPCPSQRTPPVRSRAEAREIWAERLRRFEQSGLSAAAFCQREGVSSQSPYYWRRKLAPHAPDATQPRLLPVRIPDAAPVELVLPGGCSLRLSPGCDLAFVRSLVAALGEPPC